MPWPNNLPQQLTSFIGREPELVEVRRLLVSTRLLTLTGAGGSGKTRLALQAAHKLEEEYPGGAWIIELATLSDSRLAPQAVASTLGVREDPERPLNETLAEYLKPLKLLLIFDNCEHLVDACAALAGILLRSCPQLTILATSRQGLGIDGETCWPVPPLSMPEPRQQHDPENLRQYEAVQLFMERARQRRGDLALTNENAGAVAQLCYRLDGIPLAIELAAARVKVLSVEQIVERLDERFRLLASSSHTALPRHKTLEAMMDWSYDLLSEPERMLLHALSVFAGSFTLEAVVAIAGGEIDEFEAIDLLTQLVDKSLVIVEEAGNEARYHILETIRQYAWDKAESAGELSVLRDRHLDWYTTLAEYTEDELVSNRQAVWLQRLEKEHDNLRAALTWAILDFGGPEGAPILDCFWSIPKSGRPLGHQNPKSKMGLRLAGALVWFWYFRGYLSEGRGWLEGAIACGDSGDTGQRTVALAKALSAAGVLAYLQSDFVVARARLQEGLEVWRELGDKRGAAFTLTFLGRVLAREGDSMGRGFGEESVALFREVGDQWGLALSLDFLGEEAREMGLGEAASALHEESLALYRQLGHHWGVALELSHFAQVALRQGDYAAAHRRLEEAMAIQREVGDKWMLAWTLYNLGDVVRHEGDYGQAAKLYDESLELFEEVGDKEGISSAQQGLALAQEQPTQPAQPAAPGVIDAGTSDHEELTRRELEVLAHVAQGLTDAQVAEQLVLSTRTVQAHVRSIYSKLDITTRSAATRWAMEHRVV